jgi:hypothetical protein
MNKIQTPNFIIVGTMKSGTSSLADLLSSNNNIYIPEKELHFFDNFGGYKKRWNYGLDWYSKQFLNAEENQIIGEKTPTYSYLKDVPDRILKTLPDIKLIWIFRNPVYRTYSNYWHAVINGAENKSFTYAINNEEQRMKKNIWFGYKKRSNYAEQVENYLKYFNLNKMHFITLEDLKENPEKVLRSTCTFLDVNFDKNMLSRNKISNKSYLPKSKILRYYLRKLFGPNSIIVKIDKKINITKTPYPKMSSNELDFLNKYFQKSNLKLQKLTGLDLSHWNN